MYLKNAPNSAGAYPPPQSLRAGGLLIFPDEFLEEFIEYNGFVTLEIEGNTVTSIAPNTEAWETWKAKQPEETPQTAPKSQSVTWEELDTAYNEGRDSAYDS